VVAGLKLALCSEHFEALVVAVGGAARGVDLAQASGFRANGDRGGIEVAGLADFLLHQATAGGVHALRFVAEYPAEYVEIVDQHILEDAAETLM